MSSPIEYLSTDTGAPTLSGTVGDLTTLLLAVLVNGYGAQATGVLTSDNTNVANNDTVTIGTTVYTFKTVLTGAAYEVLIGATADPSLANLADAINLAAGGGSGGGAGSEYGTGTVANTQVTSGAVAAHAITLTAIKKGVESNTVATTETSAHLSFGAVTLTGGTGHQSAGWTNPFSGVNRRSFRPGSGVQHYFQIDDNSPVGAVAAQEAEIRGYEVMTADNVGTGLFPTAAQFANQGLFIRKSAAASATTRVWAVYADDRTCHMFIASGDTAGEYYAVSFGEFFSIMSTTDSYRSILTSKIASGNAGAEPVSTVVASVASATPGNYVPRSYTGLGSALNVGITGDAGRSAGNGVTGAGGLAVPNPTDGVLHVAPLHINEPAVPAVRGRRRGLYQLCHNMATAADRDTITGSGAYAGRTFRIVKLPRLTGATGAFCIDITGPWESN